MHRDCILVHGSWHGGWCWDKIKEDLTLFDNVLTPTLPGHNSSRKLSHEEIALRDYEKHIENILESAKHPVVLVGHSLGGMVVTQVASKHYKKVSKIIYISGFVPQNNTSAAELISSLKYPLDLSVNSEACNIPVNYSQFSSSFYNCCTSQDIDFALPKLCPQPLKPLQEAITMSKGFELIPKLYVECLQDHVVHIEDQRMIQSFFKCAVESIDSDHFPFFSRKQELIKIIHNFSFD